MNKIGYRFYGWENANCPPIDKKFEKINNPLVLYDYLSKIWSKDTCAPRLRDKWSEENKTLGQCSISAFLAQDIFGGEVYGVRLDDGNFHCFNKVGNCVFDLTSEQFLNKLEYKTEESLLQKRSVHFAKEEKKARYEFIKRELEKAVK